MQSLKMRPAQDIDIPAVCHLLEQVCQTHANARADIFKSGGRKYNEAQLRGIFACENTPVFVACQGGEVVGYVFGILQKAGGALLKDTFYIDDLCVDEAKRGQGIGKALFAYACDQARLRGCYNVTLHVWKGNDRAEAFYEKLGMRTQKVCLETIL